ncbi:MAG: LysR family transcriptional regulator [Pseudomonadota bacterium]|nr:LysR family transcriptional regulator [Pseudomonadota bacterium]
MRLTLRQLQIFTAVADTGSTTAGGLRVALSQSATSGALNELEALLGARLFDRVGKRLVLNDIGRALLPQVRALLDGAKGIEHQFGIGDAAGSGPGVATRLRIGASTTIGNYLLPALMATYLRTSPATAIDVTISNTSDIATAVARLEVDVGLIEGPCHEPELQVRPWQEDDLVIVCAPSHPLVGGGLAARVGLEALRQQRWLLRESGSGTREAVEQALLSHLHQWEHPMLLGSTEAIKQAAAEGLGLACLSLCSVQDLLTLRRLVRVNSTLPRLTRRLYLIQHRQKQFSAGLQSFVAHCLSAGTSAAAD